MKNLLTVVEHRCYSNPQKKAFKILTLIMQSVFY